MTYRLIAKDLFLDALWEAAYFPLWWYGRGLSRAGQFCWRQVGHGWRALALKIFFVNFFRPMYGQRGWDAFVLSAATHFVQVFWRMALFLLWAVLWLGVLLIWVGLPILAVWGMAYR